MESAFATPLPFRESASSGVADSGGATPTSGDTLESYVVVSVGDFARHSTGKESGVFFYVPSRMRKTKTPKIRSSVPALLGLNESHI